MYCACGLNRRLRYLYLHLFTYAILLHITTYLYANGYEAEAVTEAPIVCMYVPHQLEI